jgi:hypothetical protein
MEKKKEFHTGGVVPPKTPKKITKGIVPPKTPKPKPKRIKDS